MTVLPVEHPAIPQPRIGVLLINLGTPDAPTSAAVRRYLAEFLSDRRVVEIPPLLWQPILRGIILRTRPAKSAHAYQQVWTEEGSPLAAITRAQAVAVAERMAASFGDAVIVDHAMRYGNPGIAERITALKALGCEHILVAPLYPQYCSATTASVNDAVFAALGRMRWQPALRTLPPYHDHPAYIAALKASTEASLAALDFVPDAIVASFHGMPRRTLDLGDPYHCQCQKTARLLSDALGRELIVTFQSRFGKAEWLQPATDATLIELARSGRRKVAVITPGFAADCLETLEEIAIRGRDDFMTAGGESFACLSALNASHSGVEMLEKLLVQQLEGWVKRP